MIRKIFFTLIIIYIQGLAQVQEIRLWPDKIPGAIADTSVREHIVLTETGSERIYEVTDPTLTFYYPEAGKANGAAVIICPGGGYVRLAVPVEGSPVADWLTEHGITAIILKYRLPNGKIMADPSIGPLQDIQEAVRNVRRNAKQRGIDPQRIGVMGSSAGGHVASSAATHFNDIVYEADSVSARPDFTILLYPVISMKSGLTHRGSSENLLGVAPALQLVERFSNELQVTAATPPAFLVHAADDASVPVENSIEYFLALKKNKVPAELHIYEKGGHGFGMAINRGTASDWPEACIRWMAARGILTPAHAQ